MVCNRMLGPKAIWPSVFLVLLVGLALAKVDNIIHEVRFAEPYR